MITCCGGCKNSHAECHAHCEIYAKQSAEQAAARDERFKKKQAEVDVGDYYAELRYRIKKGRFRK